MAVDAWGFDVDRQATARRLRAKRLRLSAGRSTVSVVLVLALILGGAAILRDAVLSLRWPSWASSVLFLAVLYALFVASELPFSYLGGYRLEKASGLSSQTLRGWMKDLGKTLTLAFAATILVGGILLGLLAASPMT